MRAVRAAIFVEGESDREALEALARRRHRDLESEGVAIASMGGAHAVGRFLEMYGPQGLNVRLAGLYDAGEEPEVARALGIGDPPAASSRAAVEREGFFACDPDLEAELIRALGADAVERVLAAQGDLVPFRTLQRQLPWRERAPEEQLHRFFGSGSRRKIRYGRLLIEALDLQDVPTPLDSVLAHV